MVHKGNHPFSCLKKLTFHTDELFMQTVSQAYRYVNPRSQTLLTQQRPSGPRGVCSLVANHVLGQSPRRVSHLEFNIGVGRPEHLALEFRPIMVLVNVAADLGMKLVWPSDRSCIVGAACVALVCPLNCPATVSAGSYHQSDKLSDRETLRSASTQRDLRAHRASLRCLQSCSLAERCPPSIHQDQKRLQSQLQYVTSFSFSYVHFLGCVAGV